YGFRLAPFSYVFTGGAGRFWFSLEGARSFFASAANAPIVAAAAVAAVLYAGVRRCRYFGNTAPLVIAVLLFPLMTPQLVMTPWLWALPFLFTFLGGVFSDVFQSRHRKLFLGLAGMVLLAQAMSCLMMLPEIAK
ncbi:MAG: hypothetical protein ABI158_14110, partial [Edaphobacter sp.]